jgi:RNA polymerase sigma factor (sigma-70 family)
MEQLIKKHWQFIKEQCRYQAFRFYIEPDSLHSDLLERIWIKQHQFKPETGDAGFKRWINHIIHNLCLDTYRRNQIKPTEGIDSAYYLVASNSTYEDVDLLNHTLSSIGKRYNGNARIMTMIMEGMKYDEIAKAMGIPEGTMKARLFRIRKELREAREKIEKL